MRGKGDRRRKGGRRDSWQDTRTCNELDARRNQSRNQLREFSKKDNIYIRWWIETGESLAGSTAAGTTTGSVHCVSVASRPGEAGRACAPEEDAAD